MAKNGHTVIATVQLSPYVTPLRERAKKLGLSNLRVETLDLLDPYDITRAQSFDIDVLWSNAGIGESGPVVEIPVDLARRNYEINVFKPIELSQGFIRKWAASKRKAKIVFTSSMGRPDRPAPPGARRRTGPATSSMLPGAATHSSARPRAPRPEAPPIRSAAYNL
ncbi:SDR family NAD(P)-dependent oxidoreductase [Mesorhizobium sp. CCNWLW179-1]|uniref:SDR family NAD(P)-dependent oxidoreductase n=1 Tax=unclassified Mesorhizobium TaxID=325217 RepID=UPI0030145B4C